MSSSSLLQDYTLQIGASNPHLRTVCDTVTNFDKNLIKLTKDMAKLMRLHKGTGLAAPQIGYPLRVATTIQRKTKSDGSMSEIGETVLINPTIIKHSEETFSSEEACLSLPNFVWYVDRYRRVTVEYQDIHGNHKTKEFVAYNAAVVQHEIDHLNGILFIDRIKE